MKRIASIFFLFIFLFQVGGYYVVFWAMENRANEELLQRLDVGDFTSNDAIVLTVPLNLPYPVSSGEYERVDGAFQHNGQSYNLVKQKWQNDTLFIVLVKNEESTRLAQAFSDATKFSHNLPVNNKKALNFLTKLYKDFKSTEFKMLYKSRLMYERAYYAETFPPLLSPTRVIDSPPPELV